MVFDGAWSETTVPGAPIRLFPLEQFRLRALARQFRHLFDVLDRRRISSVVLRCLTCSESIRRSDARTTADRIAGNGPRDSGVTVGIAAVEEVLVIEIDGGVVGGGR